ncbi:MAG: hypothetical protein JSS81_06110 [Acidobacteria bacterium]|nr:hypothetical protein [Acidobacteriota bacterium]
MTILRLFSIAFLLIAGAAAAGAQTPKTKPAPVASVAPAASAKASAAYAEVLLRKTELLSTLEALLVDYTEDYPKVKDLRYEVGLLQKELDRLMAVAPADAARLTAALGKLMVRKCELATDLWNLQKEFNDAHPDVKRAKRKTEIFESAVNDLLTGK